MSGFDISGLEYGASNDEIVDALARLQKQLEFMMNGNLGSKNIREVGDFLAGPDSFMSRSGNMGLSSLITGANDVRFWAGNVIPASAPFRVYEDGLMVASNAEIAGKITALLGAIGGWLIGATSIFDAAGIVGLSSAVTAGNDLRMWAGNVVPASAPFRVYEDGSVAVTKITITGKNASIMINEWGMNPDFIKRFPNKVINSGFEWYDESTLAPLYWSTTGQATKNSNWEGTVSIQLAPTQYIEQGMLTADTHAGADPAWWDNTQTRVSLKYRGGAIRVSIAKVKGGKYTIFDNSETIIRSGLFIDYPAAANWEDGYISFYFTPIPGDGKVIIRVDNVDAVANSYIDAVQIEPDFTGMWPSLYTAGPRSTPMSDIMGLPGSGGIYEGLDANKPSLNNILKSFTHSSSGLGYRKSDNTIWSVDISAAIIYQINGSLGTIISSWPITATGNGCEIDGDNPDFIWVTSGVGTIYKYQISTKSQVLMLTVVGSTNGVCSPPGPYLWVGFDTLYKVKKVNKSDGVIIAEYSTNTTATISDLAWDGENVWVSFASNSIIEAYSPGLFSFVRGFTGPYASQPGLTFDGKYLWVSGPGVITQLSEGSGTLAELYYATDTKKIYWNVNNVWVDTSSAIDHGSLVGLLDDDHTQYLNNARHDATARHPLGTVVPHDNFLGLTDSPDTYLGQTGKSVIVNASENGLIFGAAAGGGGGANSSLTSLAMYSNGMISTYSDTKVYDWNFIKDVNGKITSITNNTLLITTTITWNAGAKP